MHVGYIKTFPFLAESDGLISHNDDCSYKISRQCVKFIRLQQIYFFSLNNLRLPRSYEMFKYYKKLMVLSINYYSIIRWSILGFSMLFKVPI